MATVPNTGIPGSGVDPKLSKPNRNITGSPIGVIIAAYGGELVLDTASGQIWSGNPSSNTDWTPVFIAE